MFERHQHTGPGGGVQRPACCRGELRVLSGETQAAGRTTRETHQMDETRDDLSGSRDDPGFQTRQARPLEVADDADLRERLIRRPPFPSLIVAAGVLWIIAGAIDLSLL